MLLSIPKPAGGAGGRIGLTTGIWSLIVRSVPRVGILIVGDVPKVEILIARDQGLKDI